MADEDDPLHQARSGSDQHTRHHYKLDRSGGQRRIGSSLIHATPTGRDPIKAIAEYGARVLRVVHRPEGDDIVIITVHFDRGARR